MNLYLDLEFTSVMAGNRAFHMKLGFRCQPDNFLFLFLSCRFGKAVRLAKFRGSTPTDLLRTQLYRKLVESTVPTKDDEFLIDPEYHM